MLEELFFFFLTGLHLNKFRQRNDRLKMRIVVMVGAFVMLIVIIAFIGTLGSLGRGTLE